MMNVLLISDENYALQLTVLMTSILENSSNDFNEINFFIVNNGIAENSLEKVKSLETKYEKAKITFLSTDKIERSLDGVRDRLPIKNLSYFYRLFMDLILPEDIDKILYTDSDIVVDSSLAQLYNEDIDDYVVAGVIDINQSIFKEYLDMGSEDVYFNSGVLLVNFQKWRKDKIQDRIMDFIKHTTDKDLLYDQHILNHVLKDDIKILEPKNNVLTHMFTLNYKRFMGIFRIEDGVFNEKEYLEAQLNPRVVHYIGSPWGRPWEQDCKHPKTDLFFKYKDISPWANDKINYKPMNKSLMVKKAIVRFIFLSFPVRITSYMNKNNILNLRWFVT
ncbi:MAG: glycosyltransferase family 8 protein [Methanobrevibacter sp.]|nr:glycosyltransferase family 8 protein [Candidatus Methanovirga aequatorialis]